MCLKKILHNEISKQAKIIYFSQNQQSGDLENWLKAEKILYRELFGGLYFILGLILLIFPLYYKLAIVSNAIAWIFGWTSVGIGAGLINTRNHNYERLFMQHVLYCGFVWVSISLVSFTFSLLWSGDLFDKLTIKFFALSAIISLLGGFLVDMFYQLAAKLLKYE